MLGVSKLTKWVYFLQMDLKDNLRFKNCYDLLDGIHCIGKLPKGMESRLWFIYPGLKTVDLIFSRNAVDQSVEKQYKRQW